MISKENMEMKVTKNRVSTGYLWSWIDDEAETASHFVFKWDFNVMPTGTNLRQWDVDAIEDISLAYRSLK